MPPARVWYVIGRSKIATGFALEVLFASDRPVVAGEALGLRRKVGLLEHIRASRRRWSEEAATTSGALRVKLHTRIMGEDHFTAPELNDLHEENRHRGTTEGGACLLGHDAVFRRKRNQNTCNYRYQAYEQAKDEPAIKTRLESYNWSKEVVTSAYKTVSGGWAPSYYSSHLPAPKTGDWNVEGPPRPILRETLSGQTLKIPTGMNFTQDTWPYWNNAHHMIPKGLFNSMINAQPSPVPNVMRKALLQAKYNLNHKINMFMLPQDKEVAAILHLARHLQLRHDDAAGVKEMFTDHPGYSDLVRRDLEIIINGYKAICDQAKPDGHKIPKAELDKAKLESLSKILMGMILAWGMASPGDSLDKKASQVLRPEGGL